MLFYFTATGNSLYVAKRLDPRCISIAQAIHDDPQPYQDAQIGIVCPVHAQQIPELVSTFLHDAHFEAQDHQGAAGGDRGGRSEAALCVR